MANSLVILQKLIMLFCFIFIGYYGFKRSWITKDGTGSVSKLIVNVFNPALMLSTALCNTQRPSNDIVLQNIILVVVFFSSLILLSPLVARVLLIKKDDHDILTIMMTFGNTGFMGIPLVSSLYGANATIFVAFYVLGFNLLFYSFALYLFRRKAGDNSKFKISDMINTGTIAGVITVLVFLIPADYPELLKTCVAAVGDTCVPLAMIVTGCSLAQVEFSRIFTDWKLYAFTAMRMVLISVAAVFIFRLIPGVFSPVIAGIMVIMYGMPNGSLPVIACEEYRVDGDFCSRAFALTTLLSLVTLPLVTALL